VKVSECDKTQEYDIHQATVMGRMLNTQQRQVANAVLYFVMPPIDLNSILFHQDGVKRPSHTII